MTPRSHPSARQGINAARLPDSFFRELITMGRRRMTDPAIWLNVWTLESSLDPAIVSKIAPFARGLNQMIPTTLAGLGAPAHFERLSATQQLPWIELLIIQGEQRNGGPFRSPARYYHWNFLPFTFHRGTGPDTVIAACDASDQHERSAYYNNQGLDPTHRGKILGKDLIGLLESVRHSAEFRTAIQRLQSVPLGSAQDTFGKTASVGALLTALGAIGIGFSIRNGGGKWLFAKARA